MRILLVQTAQVGDLVLTTPLLRALRRAAGGAQVSLVTSAAGVELLGDLVDDAWGLDKRFRASSIAGLAALGARLRATPHDVAIAAHRSVRSGLVVRMSGAPVRIGFTGSSAAWACTHAVPRDLRAHSVERYLALARPLGVPRVPGDDRPVLRVDPAARGRVKALLEGEAIGPGEPIACLAPGASWATKRWSAAGFGAVAAALAGRGLAPVLVGTPRERELCVEVAAHAGGTARVVAGRVGLRELPALLERARLVVANDSGAGHVAAAVGTPVVSIFGPTVPALGYTALGAPGRIVERPGLDCRPCHRHGPERCPLGHFRCMREISAAQVLDAVDALLRAVDGASRLTGAGALHHNLAAPESVAIAPAAPEGDHR